MPDVGYILGHQDQYEELRYSLRSLTHFPHDRVWVAGAPPPDWCVNVGHIPYDGDADNGPPDRGWWARRKTNMRLAILALLDSPEVSDEFLYMNDDFVLVAPPGPLPHLGSFIESHRGRIDDKTGPYPDLYHWFVEHGVADPLHVSEHVPILVDQRLAAWMREVWHITGFSVSSLWGNLSGVPLVRGGPSVKDGDWVLRHEDEQRESWPEHWWSLSTVDRSFHEWPVGDRIRSLFPEKSPYER